MDLIGSIMFYSAERSNCCCHWVKYSGRHLTICPASQFSIVQPADSQKCCKSSFSATLCSDEYVRNVIYHLKVQLIVRVALCSLDNESKFQEVRGTGTSQSLWNPAIIQSYSIADSHLSRPTGFSSFYLIVHRGADCTFEKQFELDIWQDFQK